MSKGMQQRLGIAQAIVGGPRFLVLDEPTSALDPAGRRTVRALLEELRGRGISVLLNSHLLSEVELVCDRVVIINRGRVVAQGTPDELTAAGGVEVETGQARAATQAGREDVPATGRPARRRRRARLRRAPDPLDARGGLPRGRRGGDGVSAARRHRAGDAGRVSAPAGADRRRVLTLASSGSTPRHPPRVRTIGSADVRRAARSSTRTPSPGRRCSAWPCSRRSSSAPCSRCSSRSTPSAATPSRACSSRSSCVRSGARSSLAARFGAACGICASYAALVYAASVAITGLDGRLVARQRRRARRCARDRGMRDRGHLAAGLGVPVDDRERDRRAHDLRRRARRGPARADRLRAPRPSGCSRSAATPRGRCRSTRSTRPACTRSPPRRAASPGSSSTSARWVVRSAPGRCSPGRLCIPRARRRRRRLPAFSVRDL